jgi:Domain of unknown function (DUF1906)
VLALLPISLVAGGAAHATPASSTAWRAVAYRGVSLRVPAAWPVLNLSTHPAACPRLDVHAVYLGTPGPDPACPAGLHGVTEAVAVQPVDAQSPAVREATEPVTVGGRAALSNRDWPVTHTITDVLPAAGVEVSLSYGTDLELVRRIAATIRIGAGARAMAPAQARALARPAAVRQAAPQGLYKGPGFDACAAPTTATMQSWLASPYRAIGIYIGGINRACGQASLTASWIRSIQAMGWHYFPLYPGLQASCVQADGDATIDPADAAAEGTAAAQDAATQAENLGIPPKTPIIYDMEAYSGCSSEVITFLNSWDTELNALGYRAAVYESFSNIGDLISADGSMAEPRVIDYADWDGRATVQSSYMPATMWTKHRRIHQYLGPNNETWGGVVINIDNDRLNVRLGGLAAPAGSARAADRARALGPAADPAAAPGPEADPAAAPGPPAG